MVSSTASAFLKALLDQLRSEWQQEQRGQPHTQEHGYKQWYSLWLPELMDTMLNGRYILQQGCCMLCPVLVLCRVADHCWAQLMLNCLDFLEHAGTERSRHYVAVHALPAILTAEPSCLALLLQQAMTPSSAGEGAAAGQAGAPASQQQGVSAFVCVLRAARSLQLINSLDALLKEGALPGVDVEKVRLAGCSKS
jgi:hypothetical protein